MRLLRFVDAYRFARRVVEDSIIERWKPYSRLFLISDSASWVLSEEVRELDGISQKLGIQVAPKSCLKRAKNQSVFYADQFILLKQKWRDLPHRTAFYYLHGKPGTPDYAEFDRCYEQLCRFHTEISRIQVSHSEMRDIILDSGIAPEKVFLIPIGINLSYFRMQTLESRKQARLTYHIPESAFVVGSFQKDGVGWGDGAEPKLIKGPDIFLKTLEILQSRIPELFVLLTGPARGYVKHGLERLHIPYRHCFLETYPEIGQMYQALDVYLVASRQEGGPKAVLEAMASGVPLVTTRVGQAMDLVKHKYNGWMVNSGEVEGLAHWVEYVCEHQHTLGDILKQERNTAEANSYELQIPLWRKFMDGFVECRA